MADKKDTKQKVHPIINDFTRNYESSDFLSISCLFGDIKRFSFQISRRSASMYALPNESNCKRGIAGSLEFSKVDSLGLSKKFTSHGVAPFDVVFLAKDEGGKDCSMKILGIELMYTGKDAVLDDIKPDSTLTYIARGMLPWAHVGEY